MKSRNVLLLVTCATLGVTLTNPATAQSVCYRPDGSMYIGQNRPADCSSTPPAGRYEAIERKAAEEAVGRAERDAARQKAEAERTGVLNRSHEARRLLIENSEKVTDLRAKNLIRECETYREKPEMMPAAMTAACYRHMGPKTAPAVSK